MVMNPTYFCLSSRFVMVSQNICLLSPSFVLHCSVQHFHNTKNNTRAKNRPVEQCMVAFRRLWSLNDHPSWVLILMVPKRALIWSRHGSRAFFSLLFLSYKNPPLTPPIPSLFPCLFYSSSLHLSPFLGSCHHGSYRKDLQPASGCHRDECVVGLSNHMVYTIDIFLSLTLPLL